MAFSSLPPPRPPGSVDSLHDPVDHEVPALRSLNAGLAEVESVGPHMKYSVEGEEDDDDDDDGDDDLVRVGVHDTAGAGQLRILEVVGAVLSHDEIRTITVASVASWLDSPLLSFIMV